MGIPVLHGVVSVLMPGVVPLFLMDQFAAYGRALLSHRAWAEGKTHRDSKFH
jgi:hypothetical protein